MACHVNSTTAVVPSLGTPTPTLTLTLTPRQWGILRGQVCRPANDRGSLYLSLALAAAAATAGAPWDSGPIDRVGDASVALYSRATAPIISDY